MIVTIKFDLNDEDDAYNYSLFKRLGIAERFLEEFEAYLRKIVKYGDPRFEGDKKEVIELIREDFHNMKDRNEFE